MPAVPLPQFSHYPALPPPVAVRLTPLSEHSCPYLPGRQARSRAFVTDRMPNALYHRFMDAGFRRSGRLFYQPTCAGCRACVPVRVPVATFRPSKSQRRCRRQNADLSVTTGEPVATAEKHALYARYLTGWHRRDDEGFGPFASFLYDSPVDTVEFQYRDPSGRLLAVGICDVCEASLSSVYFYFDPAEAARGLGTFGALQEIDAAMRLGISYYYLGYWVSGCRQMRYKTTYRPCELLGDDGTWRPVAPDDHPAANADGSVETTPEGRVGDRPPGVTAGPP